MERNAHRLTLHSPAEKSLPQPQRADIDFGHFYLLFCQYLLITCSNHNHLRLFIHQATASTSATSKKQKVPKP